MSAVAQSLLTVGEIAKRLGVPSHRVVYLVRARGLKPRGVAGHFRVFSEDDYQLIASELHRIEEGRR